ncbi:hypothetical protein ACFQZX_07185 [Mucilaginibacter litoreus]|uniref:Uncharacterized protein n=1 Tax=Mucilaginibacter litoreus TaxID=1048221 RepID=A0ABW3ASA6_9SPHI
MKSCLIIVILSCFFNWSYGQLPSEAIDSLIKFRVINAKERPALEKEVKYIRGTSRANYRIAILGGLENIILQKRFHVNPRTTGWSFSYRNEHLDKASQDSTNISLQQLLEKIKKSGLLSQRVYSYAQKGIESGDYVLNFQLIGSLTEMSSRLEWLAPSRLLPVAAQLHKYGIVSDSSFLRLKNDINNGKLESAFELNNYCKYDRVFDMAKYPDDPNVWLEQMHRDIASILPGLDFTDFSYTEIPDTSFSIPGVRFKVSLKCNGRIYKHISLPISNYKNPKGKISPEDIFTEDFYRIFNKILTDQQSPYRLHGIMFSYTMNSEDIRRCALIALKNEQGDVFMKDPVMSYMMVSMDDYDSNLTSTKIDSTMSGWKRMGLFAHLSETDFSKALGDAQAADPFSTSILLSNFPDVIYNLHDALNGGPQLAYINLLNHLAKITHGEFTPTKAIQIKKAHGIKLQYVSKGKIHSYTFPTTYGWMDVKFPAFMNNLSLENNLAGNFYQLKYDDAIIYLTKKQHEYALKNKLMEFASTTKKR